MIQTLLFIIQEYTLTKMKNDTFFHNVNPKFAETVMRTHNKSKAINQQLLQLISRVRLLQDNLLEQQYRYEMLLDNNNQYKQRLNELKMKNEEREAHLKKLDQEMELHKIKNKELHICEESLKILEKQIYELNESAQRKEDQCELLKRQSEKIRLENVQLTQKNKQAYQKSVYTNSVIQDFLNLRMITYQEDQPVDYLRVKLQNLRQALFELESNEADVKKEQMQQLKAQKEKTIKLQFQEQLLQQRENDDEKIKAINDMCQNQENLQKVVEEMLIKEDELVEEVKRSKLVYQTLEKTVAEDMRQIQESWDEERQSLYSQLRELKMVKERLMYQAADLQKQTNERKQKFSFRSQQQQMMLRMNGQLQLMKRLRQAEQKNNYLKLKIKQATSIKVMMTQEKELVRTRRFSY